MNMKQIKHFIFMFVGLLRLTSANGILRWILKVLKGLDLKGLDGKGLYRDREVSPFSLQLPFIFNLVSEYDTVIRTILIILLLFCSILSARKSAVDEKVNNVHVEILLNIRNVYLNDSLFKSFKPGEIVEIPIHGPTYVSVSSYEKMVTCFDEYMKSRKTCKFFFTVSDIDIEDHMDVIILEYGVQIWCSFSLEKRETLFSWSDLFIYLGLTTFLFFMWYYAGLLPVGIFYIIFIIFLILFMKK